MNRLSIASALTQRAGGSAANAAQVADVVVVTWQEISTALQPILGQQGVAALYERSLHLSAATHAWLTNTREGDRQPMDLLALKALLTRQTGADALTGSIAVLQAFHDLLVALVGLSLTERLLHSVWDKLSSNQAPLP